MISKILRWSVAILKKKSSVGDMMCSAARNMQSFFKIQLSQTVFNQQRKRNIILSLWSSHLKKKN